MRFSFRIAVFALCCIFVSVAGPPAAVHAQQHGGLEFVSASNGTITVQVERHSGQFRIVAADGTPLLFTSGKGVTGYTNVHYDANTYTTNLLHRPAPPSGSRPMTGLSVEELSDRVRLRAPLVQHGDTLLFQQDLIPTIDGDYSYINIVTTLENRSDRAINAGSLLMHDIMIGKLDGVDLTVDDIPVIRERAWEGSTVPDKFEASTAGSAYTVRGRLSSATADRPDMFIAGNWQFNGYLGTAVWEYDPSGLVILDDAVLLKWDDEEIPAQGSRRMRTDYGFLALTNVALTCDLPDLVLNKDSTSYAPSPIPATAVITNIGALPLSNLDVQISLPPELRPLPGEALTKTITGPLLAGKQETLTWLLTTDPVDQPTRVVADFAITSPQSLERQCSAETVIPALKPPLIELDCGDTLRLDRNPEGGGYAPDPFAISVYVENVGNNPVSNLQAELILPPGLVLVSGSAQKAVLPDPLLPGSGTIVDWAVRGIIQNSPLVASYTVRVFNTRVETTCENAVIIPLLLLDPCVEPGVNTAGTAFWVGFLPDAVGLANESLQIFVSAPEESIVRIMQPGTAAVDTLRVPAGGLRMLEVDPAMNNYAPETVDRQGIRVLSDLPVHLFAGNFRDRHTDAYTVLPDHALGTQYVTAGYNWADASEHFCIVAAENGTEIRIIPSAFTSTGRPSGQEITVNLDAGELYYIRAFVAGAGGSLTGSRITSTKPVAVISGAETGWVPEQGGNPSAFLNPLAEQMIPRRYLGNEYVMVPFRSRFGGDTYRIIALDDNTTVSVGNGPPLTLHPAGMWIEDLVSSPVRIQSNNPVMVAQYANSAQWDSPSNEYGDGSMLLLVPTDRYMSCHYFPAGTLVADVAIVPNMVAQVDDVSRLETDKLARLGVPVFTAECWLQTLSGGVIVSRTSGDSALWKLEYENMRARIGFHTERPGYGSYETSRDNSIINGAWSHIALVVDGPGGNAIAYVNGNKVMDATFSPTDFIGDAGLAWGGMFGDTALSFIGQFDECRFWEGKRSEAQIRASMDQRLGALDRSGLLGYWSFCTDFSDETRYGHDLRPRGNPRFQESYNLPATVDCVEQKDSNFVNLVVPSGGETAVTLNYGAMSLGDFTTLSGSGYSFARLWLPTGINRIETSDVRGMGVSSYGFAYHDAYTTYTGFRVSGGTQSVKDAAAPGEIQLHAPWPTPASDRVFVRYTLSRRNAIRLTIYDFVGRKLQEVEHGAHDPGTYEIAFDVSDIPSGTYVLQLDANGTRVQRQVVLLH